MEQRLKPKTLSKFCKSLSFKKAIYQKSLKYSCKELFYTFIHE